MDQKYHELIVAEKFLTLVTLYQDLHVAGAHWEHRDPFDQMLACKCRLEKLQLVSRN